MNDNESFDTGDRMRIGALWVVIAGIISAVISWPAAGVAQGGDQSPVVLSIVHVGEGMKGSNYRELASVLRNSESIKHKRPNKVIRELATRGVQRETLRDAGKRVDRWEEIGDAMRGVELELMFVFWETREKMNLVVIGPTGRELRQFRRDPGRRLSRSDSKQLLKEAFEVAMPEVYDFREDPEKQRAEARKKVGKSSVDQQSDGEDEEATDAGSDEPDSPEELRREAMRRSRVEHGNMRRHIRGDFQPIGGARALQLDTPNGFSHNVPILGARLDLQSILSVINSETVGLAVTGLIDLSAFQTTFNFDDGSSETYPGSYFQGQTTFRYMKGLSPSIIIFGEAGANYTSVGLADNETYVGSKYWSGVGGFGLLIRPNSDVDVEVAGRVLPILSGDTSDGAYGSSTPGIGFNGRAKVAVRMFKPWRLTAFYDLSYMSLNHSEPPNLEVDSVGASDWFHVAGLGVGYRFGFGR